MSGWNFYLLFLPHSSREVFPCIFDLVRTTASTLDAQFRFNFVIHCKHSRIYNTHIQAQLGRHGTRKASMHGFTDKIIATEREGNITDSTTGTSMGAAFFYFPDGINKIKPVGIVLGSIPVARVNTLGSKIISAGGKPYLFDQNIVRTFANTNLFVKGGGLSFFIECHNNHRRTVPHRKPGVLFKSFLPSL